MSSTTTNRLGRSKLLAGLDSLTESQDSSDYIFLPEYTSE